MKLLHAIPMDVTGVSTGWLVCFYIYLAILGLLCLFGIHRYLMVYLYYRHKKNAPRPKEQFTELPPVTVQLPVFNELYVVERLIDSVCAIRYPRHLLEVQVLDDSTDETVDIVRNKVEQKRAEGINIVQLHRTNREGYKAGALAEGLKQASGRFIAIFDADFIPTPDFLEKTVHFFTDPKIGMVQTRWGHVNRDYSMLTKVQAILLDGHFMIEHTARNRSGRFFNFSGTGGIWRREAIETAGGWQGDTVAEDFDLSYRSQLKDWKFVFVNDVVSPAELPAEMNGFRTQQERWSKGQIQTARKLFRDVLRAKIPLFVKVEAITHMTCNFAYPLVFLLALLMLPVTMARGYSLMMKESVLVDLAVFAAATFSAFLFYLCSQREIHPGRFWQHIRHIPMLLALCIGLCVNNARSVIMAFWDKKKEFIRTPKYNIQNKQDTITGRKYRGIGTMLPFVELAMACYFMVIIALSIKYELYGAIPFQLLFAFGFGYMAVVSLFQARLPAPEACGQARPATK